MRTAIQIVVVMGLSVVGSTQALATYSPPLTEVRIDEDKYLHTPSIVAAGERRTTFGTDVELTGYGVQYLGQFEWSSGFGLLVGVAGGYGTVEGDLGRNGVLSDGLPAEVETDGYWLGGQLRAYYMLGTWTMDERVERPSAITAFVNVRSLYYDMEGEKNGEFADLEFIAVTGGVGAMVELSINDYISICPYAWLTPGVLQRLDYNVRGENLISNQNFTMRNPFLVGIDVWVYTTPPNWTDHFSLSVLGSFVDTDGDDQAIAVVAGYTF